MSRDAPDDPDGSDAPGDPDPPGIDPEPTSGDAVPGRLRDRLRSEGMRVTAAGEVDGALEIVYETTAPIVPPGQVGHVLSALRAFDGYEPREVGATVVDREGRTVGVWSVRGAWMRALREGDLSESELAQRAVDSIENY